MNLRFDKKFADNIIMSNKNWKSLGKPLNIIISYFSSNKLPRLPLGLIY